MGALFDLLRHHPDKSDYGKRESDYYRIRSNPPAPPKEGTILLLRVPHTSIIRVIYPDGQSERFVYANDWQIRFSKLGIPKERHDDIARYLWNFYKVYVSTNAEIQVSTNLQI